MRDEQLREMGEYEETYFWYKARREIIESVMLSHGLLVESKNVLEIGSANGINVKYFLNILKT